MNQVMEDTEFIKYKAKCENLLTETLAPTQSTNDTTKRTMQSKRPNYLNFLTSVEITAIIIVCIS